MPGFPWALILKQGPQLMTSAVNLLTVSRGRAAEPATAKDLQALVVRVAEVVKDQQAFATLVKDLTQQLNAITEGAHATAARARLALLLGASGLALGLVACMLVLMR